MVDVVHVVRARNWASNISERDFDFKALLKLSSQATSHVTTSHVTTSHVRPIQANSRQAKASQTMPSQLNSRHVTPGQVKSSQVKSSQRRLKREREPDALRVRSTRGGGCVIIGHAVGQTSPVKRGRSVGRSVVRSPWVIIILLTSRGNMVT